MIRLLLIDDDPQAQKTLKMVLEEDFEVHSAFTGIDGVERIRKYDPDVVLLDINLPNMDGLRVLEKIRSIPAPPSVIMLTAYSDINLVVAAVKAKAYFRLYLFLANDTVQRSICDRKCPNRSLFPYSGVGQ